MCAPSQSVPITQYTTCGVRQDDLVCDRPAGHGNDNHAAGEGMARRVWHTSDYRIPVTGVPATGSERRDSAREAVNHPAHYGGDVEHEVWKCLEAWGLHLSAYAWNAVKYIARAGKKDPKKHIEDMRKAQWYLEHEITRLEKELRENNPA